ncbi:uncharacterized protein C2845_PM06G29680 [Panicum miliaceum]|uniref:PXMP2/4 family protein 4-like n=1 Tax=Panicum miliaceum TaxID=4540 RepID=A0A3L6R9H2_PANMI|nr:uncharacterized protein C2845_PM06G29680 [Panicum miliaceum]
MATAGAFHAGGRLLLPLRRSPHGPSPSPWSHLRSHLVSSKPSSSAPHPPPLPPARSAPAAFSFAPTSRKTGAVGAGVVGCTLNLSKSMRKQIRYISSFCPKYLQSMCTLGPEVPLDFLRTIRMASYGLLISGPTLHLWFNFISKVFPKKDVVNTLKKMFLGQAVYGPIINSVFFSYNAGLQGETVPEITARLKRDLVPTIKSGILYWPACDFITFKFVPVHLQAGLMDVSWNYEVICHFIDRQCYTENRDWIASYASFAFG